MLHSCTSEGETEHVTSRVVPWPFVVTRHVPRPGLYFGGQTNHHSPFLTKSWKVAELVTRCVWEAVVLVNVVLWILSTKLGTLALCGRLCICASGGKFVLPYVRKFADLPVERREEALTQWNKTRWLFPLKITFMVIKVLSHYAFYTMVCMFSALLGSWSHAF